MKNSYSFFIVVMIITLSSYNVYGLISPVQRDENQNPALTNCEDIRLVSQKITLYHHPLGIWQITCCSDFVNLYPKPVSLEMGFNSGYDIGMIEGELYCDEFKNFNVLINGEKYHRVKLKETCPNYVERIGMFWTNDDRSGIGYLNTWQVDFRPEEKKQITVTYNFIVTKPGIKYDPQNKEQWYSEQMSWVKHEYNKKAENDFILPLNMGSFWAISVDSVILKTYFSKEWLQIEDQEHLVYEPQHVVIYTYCEPVGFYSPPPNELIPLSEDDLKNKTSTELVLLRNSFFAKYGRQFSIDWLKLFFKKQPWYYQNPDYDNWYLTDFDIANIKFIHNYENRGK